MFGKLTDMIDNGLSVVGGIFTGELPTQRQVAKLIADGVSIAGLEAERDAALLRLGALGLAPKLDVDAQVVINRLGAMYSHRGDGFPTQYVNPDGPYAVAVIERLTAEVARLRKDAQLRGEG